MSYTLTITHTLYTPKDFARHMADLDQPQIALAGRSNVGKSSLINCLAGRKALAKISSTPGKTRSINFYQVQPGGWYLVDLPGYGYAKRSKTERQQWAQLIDRYLSTTSLLQAVTILLDCRLPPQKNDMELVDYVRANQIPLLPVLTKADKVKQNERAARQKEWKAILVQDQSPLLVSSKTGMGRDKLWERFHSLLPLQEEPHDNDTGEPQVP